MLASALAGGQGGSREERMVEASAMLAYHMA